jgi:predicted TIM-barrel fold metal-dependent hydrolase
VTTDDTPVIDVWANWWPGEFFAACPLLMDLYRRLDLVARSELKVPDLLAEAAAGGVDRIVLSATAFPGSPATNDAVRAVVDLAPDRLIGCASIDPREGIRALAELRRAVGELGFRALKILPFLYGLPPSHAIYYPLYAACAELGIPVLILTGHTAVALPNESGRPGHLDEVALHFPELTIVAGHAGFPWTRELLSLAWKHPNLHIDTSGHRPKYFPPELRQFLKSYGRGKVLFGTGYPMMDYAGPLAELAALDLKPEAKAAFLGGNAARIFGLRPAAGG